MNTGGLGCSAGIIPRERLLNVRGLWFRVFRSHLPCWHELLVTQLPLSHFVPLEATPYLYSTRKPNKCIGSPSWTLVISLLWWVVSFLYGVNRPWFVLPQGKPHTPSSQLTQSKNSTIYEPLWISILKSTISINHHIEYV